MLHGVNCGAFGARQPELYGADSLAAINRRLIAAGRRRGCRVACRRTDDEATFVRAIHAAGRTADGLLCNPGAWTHTSVAVRDAVASVAIPVIEVHCSNIFAREPFRRNSFVAPLVRGMIAGFGPLGYALGLEALIAMLDCANG